MSESLQKKLKKFKQKTSKKLPKIAIFTPRSKNLGYNNNVIKKGRLKVARGEKNNEKF